MNFNTTDVDMLDAMTYDDLETMKQRLDIVRRRILALQNSQSFLFKLPGELRNRILLFAMHGELVERRKRSKHATMFREPAFFATSRQIKAECTGVWFNDILVWEELVDVPTHPMPDTGLDDDDNASHVDTCLADTVQTDCMGTLKTWKRLPMDEVKRICCEHNQLGKLTLVTQAAHCNLKRSREAVESSRSICPRKGLVRMKGVDSGMMALRWWVW